jgi:cytochrome c-type biogenesis protein CcmH/NrfG
MTVRLLVRYLAALVPLLAILPIIPGQAQLNEPFGKDPHGGPVLELRPRLRRTSSSSTTWPAREAFAEQKRALALDPQDADGWNNLGALLARGGQTAAARSAFEHALRIQPNHAQAKANLARLTGSN